MRGTWGEIWGMLYLGNVATHLGESRPKYGECCQMFSALPHRSCVPVFIDIRLVAMT